MKRTPLIFSSLALAATFAFTSCDTPEGIGALAGAGAGSIIGSTHGHHAAEGALIGAGAGALLGHLLGHADDRGYYEGERYPYGRSLGSGYVESPYSPHNVIDTRGIPHGAVVEDPSTGGRFIKP